MTVINSIMQFYLYLIGYNTNTKIESYTLYRAAPKNLMVETF